MNVESALHNRASLEYQRSMWRTLVLSSLSALLLPACVNEASIDRRAVAPTVAIQAPTTGELFRQGDDGIAFVGTVDDTRDVPEELSVRWFVDAGEEGELEFAASVDTEGNVTGFYPSADLILGAHTVTLSATDSDDATGVASVAFDIGGPLGAPEVTILTPEDFASFDPGESITFQGEAVDATTPPDELVFTWASDVDGVLDGALSGDGQSIVIASEMSVGEHSVTLSVVDGDGETGTASITVSVAELVTKAEPGDLVFSEMMVNPQVVPDEVGEWVELYNTSGAPIQVTGYNFRDDDTDSWILEGAMVIEPYSYFVLCANTDPAVNGGVPCDAWFKRSTQGDGLALANNPDELVLTRPDGIEIDWLHYTNEWWVAGATIGVDPGFLDGGANDDVTHWCVQSTVITSGGEAGTPGLENDPCP